jgi:hypothetical protein
MQIKRIEERSAKPGLTPEAQLVSRGGQDRGEAEVYSARNHLLPPRSAQTLEEVRMAADMAVFASLLAITQTKNQSPIQDLPLTQR